MPDNLGVENPQGSNPFAAIQPRQYPYFGDVVPQSLDALFNAQIQQNIAKKQGLELQAQQAQANTSLGAFGITQAQLADPSLIQQAQNQPQMTPEVGQGQGMYQNPGQPQEDPVVGHIRNYFAFQRQQAQMGFQGQQVQLAGEKAKSQLLQGAAQGQANDLGLGGPTLPGAGMGQSQEANPLGQTPQQPNQVKTVSDANGNQYIRTWDPNTGVPKYEKVDPQKSIKMGDQNIPLSPGTEYKEPPGASDATTSLQHALEMVPELQRYEQALNALPKAGRANKIGDILNQKTGVGPQYDAVRAQNAVLQQRLLPFITDIKRTGGEAAGEAAQNAIANAGSTVNEQLESIKNLKNLTVDKITSSQAVLKNNLVNHPILNNFVKQQAKQPKTPGNFESNPQAIQIRADYKSGKINRQQAAQKLQALNG